MGPGKALEAGGALGTFSFGVVFGGDFFFSSSYFNSKSFYYYSVSYYICCVIISNMLLDVSGFFNYCYVIFASLILSLIF